MLKAANWIREDLKRIPRVAELLAFVAGPNPTGGSIYKEGFIDNSQNMSTPLAQVTQLIERSHFCRLWQLRNLYSSATVSEQGQQQC
jgi:hypothetical protein